MIIRMIALAALLSAAAPAQRLMARRNRHAVLRKRNLNRLAAAGHRPGGLEDSGADLDGDGDYEIVLKRGSSSCGTKT
jgi:hypothetical protein